MYREPIFAEQGWYPANPQVLEEMIRIALPAGKESPLPGLIRGIIAPHAGYIYSLKTALHAYTLLKASDYDRVFVLGPSHRHPCNGKAILSDYDAFKTPLGLLPVDVSLIRRIAAETALFSIDNAIHCNEHSLEMQLPLIRKFLGEKSIIPVILPPSDPDTLIEIGKSLSSYFEKNSLVIMSTDLSHFPPESMAREIDADAMASWETLNPRTLWETEIKWNQSGQTDCAMCGVSALVAGIEAINHSLRRPRLLRTHHSTSADSGSDKDRVVGYGSAVIFEEESSC